MTEKEEAKREFKLPYKFEPRWYQVGLLKALDAGVKRAVCCLHRGAGKDLMCLNYLIKRAFEKPGVYLHCFPNFNQGKRAIWKSVHDTHDGEAIGYLDHIPPELVKHKNSSEMMIEFINGSIYCVMGLDGKNAARARGMNPCFVILSEYAYMDPESWHTVEPRIAQNDGTAIFISTPNGQNHFYELYNHARQNDKYYSSLMTVADTKTIPDDHIDNLRAEGVPEDFIQQEYFCSFTRGAEGAYYGKYIQKARDDGRICALPIHDDLPCHTSWDLGIGDSTSIWIFQALTNGCFNFIDYYENQGEGLGHYVKYLNKFQKEHDVVFGTHFLPHDAANRELIAGIDRTLALRELGIKPTVLGRGRLEEGIQAVRSVLNRCYFDETRCQKGIKCLDFYCKKYNEAMKVYYDTPLHNRWSHGCFVKDTMIKIKNGEKPIQNIKVGDEVVTPFGLRKVTKTFIYESSNLLNVNDSITATGNHKVFTKRGLVYCDALRYDDVIYKLNESVSWKRSSSLGEDIGFKEAFILACAKITLSLTDLTGDGTDIIISQEENKKEKALYIVPYGLNTIRKYVRDIIFIIKTITQKIMKSIISSVCQQEPIYLFQPNEICGLEVKKTENSSMSPVSWQQNGTDRTKAKIGIKYMEKKPGIKGKSIQKYVNFAETFTRQNGSRNQDSVGITANLDIEESKIKMENLGCVLSVEEILNVTNILSQNPVQKLVPISFARQQKVYDFEVQHDHCYFANGILVSNSDAFRYFAVGIKTKGLSEEGSADQDIEILTAYLGR